AVPNPDPATLRARGPGCPPGMGRRTRGHGGGGRRNLAQSWRSNLRKRTPPATTGQEANLCKTVVGSTPARGATSIFTRFRRLLVLGIFQGQVGCVSQGLRRVLEASGKLPGQPGRDFSQ